MPDHGHLGGVALNYEIRLPQRPFFSKRMRRGGCKCLKLVTIFGPILMALTLGERRCAILMDSIHNNSPYLSFAYRSLPSAVTWIDESNTKLFLSAQELVITGTNINCGIPPGGTVSTCLDLVFSPPLLKDVDYTQWSDCCSLTELRLTIISGRQWGLGPGPLYLKRIRSGYEFDPPVLVANIVPDPVVLGVTTVGPLEDSMKLHIALPGQDIDLVR